MLSKVHKNIYAEQISDNAKYKTKTLKDMYHQGVLTLV